VKLAMSVLSVMVNEMLQGIGMVFVAVIVGIIIVKVIISRLFS
jgi:hypothetical protein